MKLRIPENSIRFRLTQSEVGKLGSGRRVEGAVRFAPAPGTAFSYVVETSPRLAEVRALGSDREIRVTLPADLARTWATTDQVSIEQRQQIEPGSFLSIVLEKDFRCLHNPTGRQEGDADYFPNPAEATNR